MMDKSTIKTSRKIYAMKYGIKSILILNFIGITANIYKSGVIDGGVLIAVSASIGAIVTGLQIADGMKGHESGRD